MALDLVIVTPEGEAFSDRVEHVVLPGSEGEFGVLEAQDDEDSELTAEQREEQHEDGCKDLAYLAR